MLLQTPDNLIEVWGFCFGDKLLLVDQQVAIAPDTPKTHQAQN